MVILTVKYFLVTLLIGLFVWQYSVNLTQGMLLNRYSG